MHKRAVGGDKISVDVEVLPGSFDRDAHATVRETQILFDTTTCRVGSTYDSGLVVKILTANADTVLGSEDAEWTMFVGDHVSEVARPFEALVRDLLEVRSRRRRRSEASDWLYLGEDLQDAAAQLTNDG